MPNWVENQLKISGEPEHLTALREFISGTNSDGEPLMFDFEKVIPTPEELALTNAPNTVNAQEMIDKYGHADWYEFRYKRWGTKWNLHDNPEIIDTSDTVLKISFDTAWWPPDGVIAELSVRFPQLRFELWSCDPAIDWAFYMEFDLGSVILFEEVPYDQEIKEMFGHEDWDDDYE
jgi:hypothetical protein